MGAGDGAAPVGLERDAVVRRLGQGDHGVADAQVAAGGAEPLDEGRDRREAAVAGVALEGEAEERDPRRLRRDAALAKLVDAMPWAIDVMEVIRGANSLKKGQHHVNILHPANGVGGYCLTKDPWFVDALGRRAGIELRIPRAARAVNDSMPGHVFDRVMGALGRRGLAPRDARVALLGFSFKSNSGDCRFTPVAPLVAKLRAAGCDLRICDPMVTAAEAEHHGIDLVPGWQEAVEGADAVLILAGHDAFTGIAAEDFARLAPGALIYDGRIDYPRGRIAELEAAGLAYMGVGR